MSGRVLTRLAVSFAVMLSVLLVQSSYAETYLAGQLGVTLPQDLTGVNFDAPLPGGFQSSDLDLKPGFMYGAKFGHYFESLKWLGIEAEIVRTTPHLKQQPITTISPFDGTSSTRTEPGALLGVTALALNLQARYPGDKLQPYVGIGPGLFFARLKSASPPTPSEEPTTSFGEAAASTLGLNIQVGLRYFVTPHVALFSEWKFNHARFSFDSTIFGTNTNATYDVHHLAFGIGYHFD